MGSKELGTGEWEALIFAPLWVYTAVAGAEGPPETSQFRRLTQELDDAHVRFGGSGAAGTTVETLRGNLDALWAAYHAGGVDPQRGLKRTRGVLKRVPEGEGQAFVQWLVELAVRIGESRHTVGQVMVSERERRVIRDVAKWLGAPPPDLEATTGE